MGVLQQPGAIGLPFRAQHLDRLGNAFVRGVADRSEVFEAAEDVIVPACRE